MKKTILVLALFLSAFAFSQTFEKAIISDSEHTYDLVNNLSSRIIRAIPSNGGVQFSDDTLTIYVVVYGITVENYTDEKGVAQTRDKPFKLPQFSEKLVYTKTEVNALFSKIGNPIETNEDFIGELNNLIETALLSETLRKGYFNGDKFTIYNP